MRDGTGSEQPGIQLSKEIPLRSKGCQHKYSIAADVFGLPHAQDEIAIEVDFAIRVHPNDLRMLSRIDELHVDPILFQPLETKIRIAGWTLPVVDDLDGFLG